MTCVPEQPRYPRAERADLVEVIHDRQVADPYRWLENGADPDSIAWSDAQDRLFTTAMAGWSRRDELRRRLDELARFTTVSPPVHRGERVFFTRRGPDDEHPVLFMTLGDREQRLFDPRTASRAGRITLDSWEPSWEGELLAVQQSADGTEESSLRIIEVETGRLVDGPIDRVRHSAVAWLPGGRAFYYVRRLPPEENPGEERYHRRVYFHRVGTDPRHDVMVFGEGRGATQLYGVSITPDGRRLSVRAVPGPGASADLYLADLTTDPPHRPRFVPVQQDTGARSTLHVLPGAEPPETIHLITNLGAPRGRIVTAPATEPSSAHWSELIPEDPQAVLAEVAMLADPALELPLLLVSSTRHAVSEVGVHDAGTGARLAKVPLPGAGTVREIRTKPAGGHEAWFRYTDHTTPPVVLRFDGSTGRTEPWLESESAATVPDVKSLQVAFDSADGTRIRMFIISSGGVPDRPRPTILTGYGGFGASKLPHYAPDALAWAELGGVYAVACLRGGGEEGEQWHHAGRGASKKRVFEDFEAAADWLVANGWSAPHRLGILGGSNGGLLVGAALTRHPEKYAAAVCAAPLLDMVRYERSGFGPSWREEYGGIADPEAFANLLSYSPYHNVRAGERYPAVMFVVGDGDSRVDPLHARKMCAALQFASTGPGPILLHAVKGVGHGARASSSTLALAADTLAFFADRLRLADAADGGAEGHRTHHANEAAQ
jgi:prolyl oligopeptidase